MEIRRCGTCDSPAMVSVADVKETRVFGLLDTDRVVRRHFVCQACGEHIALGGAAEGLKLIVLSVATAVSFGTIGLCAGIAVLERGSVLAGVGLVVLGAAALVQLPVATWWAFLPWWRRYRSPIVVGASAPPIRFPFRVSDRRCRCGAAARCTRVEDHAPYSIPMGTTWTYECTCRRRFLVESGLSAFTLVAGGLLFAAIGVALLMSDGGPTLGRGVFGGGMLLLGVVGGLIGVLGAASPLLHPVVAQRGSRR